MVSNLRNIHLGIYKNYQNFRTLIFFGYARLRGVGATATNLFLVFREWQKWVAIVTM